MELIIRRVFSSHDYNYIIHYVNPFSSRKYRPAATQGGFKMDRTFRFVRGVMAVCMGKIIISFLTDYVNRDIIMMLIRYPFKMSLAEGATSCSSFCG